MSLVTIGVPAYCNARTIERTIASITRQTHYDFRAIVSDDASDDETFELCRAGAEGDKRLKVVRQETRQGFMHFARLVAMADTPYFVWLAGDDWWAPEFLELTLSALQADAEAVSAIPRVSFMNAPPGTVSPDTSTLAGDWADRVSGFLVRPNGSRMYGLFRTDILRAALPRRVMNAFDFYLTLGALKHGPQIAVPEVLLYRERTDWRAYSRIVDDIYPPGIHRRYPLLDMTLAALRSLYLPPTPAIARQVYRLNVEKRDERAMIVTPGAFFNAIAEGGADRVLERNADLYAHEAAALLSNSETPKDVAAAAEMALMRLAQSGNPSALYRAGRRLAEIGEVDGARRMLGAAARSGHAEAKHQLIKLEADNGLIEPDALTDVLVADALAGSDLASEQLATLYCEGRVAGVSATVLSEIFECAGRNQGGAVVRAQARMAADGFGGQCDTDRAIALLDTVAANDVWARRDRGLLLLRLGREDEAIQDLTSAAESGAGWAVSDLLAIPAARNAHRTNRLVRNILEDPADTAFKKSVREKSAAQATLREPTPDVPRRITPATPKGEANITAVVVARNAAATLPRMLRHYADERIPVLVVDHGSCDATAEIALAHRDAPVAGFFREPYRGYFDLTRQLELKRDLIRTVETEWILHADADEFLETRDGTSLRQFVGRYEGTKAIAFDCIEHAFLPRSEGEGHRPESFPETMRHYVVIEERDRKQRLFRRSAELDVWMQTGGHTVSFETGMLAEERLRLRHYVGLSLDHLRSQYLTRVFAGEDRVKAWHSNRKAEAGDFVQVPDATPFRDCDADGWCDGPVLSRLPVFSVLPSGAPLAATLPNAIRLLIAAADRETAAWAEQAVATCLPDLDLGTMTGDANAIECVGTRPILHVIGLPSSKRPDPVAWLCGVTAIRQAALIGRRRYVEVRREDCVVDAQVLCRAVLELLASKPGPITEFPQYMPLQGAKPGKRLLQLGGAMLTELGYVGGRTEISE